MVETLIEDPTLNSEQDAQVETEAPKTWTYEELHALCKRQLQRHLRIPEDPNWYDKNWGGVIYKFAKKIEEPGLLLTESEIKLRSGQLITMIELSGSDPDQEETETPQ